MDQIASLEKSVRVLTEREAHSRTAYDDISKSMAETRKSLMDRHGGVVRIDRLLESDWLAEQDTGAGTRKERSGDEACHG